MWAWDRRADHRALIVEAVGGRPAAAWSGCCWPGGGGGYGAYRPDVEMTKMPELVASFTA
jgi:hypothetical protein